MSSPPIVEIEMDAFWKDPYPVLEQLRREAPIAFVPQMRGVAITRRDDIIACEKNTAVFSSHQPNGLMNKLMGHNMMRKDGTDHLAERKVMFASVSPKTVREQWRSIFQQDADQILSQLRPRGRADLFSDYAMLLSGQALKTITGLTQVSAADLDSWSQAMIAGIANYIGEPEPEARCHAATAAIDAAIDEMTPVLRDKPDFSMLSVMLNADMPMDSIRANIKLTVSGGQNEPRDAIAGAVWALLSHPAQLQLVQQGKVSWMQVFEEYVRWISPIGMSPRRVAKPHTVRDVRLEPGTLVFFMFGSANRDANHFENPDVFDISRDTSKHIAFGAGPHFCAGAAASKTLVAEVGLPSVFAHLPELRLDPDDPVRLGGWAFRGPLNLPVVWDCIS